MFNNNENTIMSAEEITQFDRYYDVESIVINRILHDQVNINMDEAETPDINRRQPPHYTHNASPYTSDPIGFSLVNNTNSDPYKYIRDKGMAHYKNEEWQEGYDTYNMHFTAMQQQRSSRFEIMDTSLLYINDLYAYSVCTYNIQKYKEASKNFDLCYNSVLTLQRNQNNRYIFDTFTFIYNYCIVSLHNKHYNSCKNNINILKQCTNNNPEYIILLDELEEIYNNIIKKIFKEYDPIDIKKIDSKFICPLSNKLIFTPILCSDGNFYDYNNLLISGYKPGKYNISPLTGKEFTYSINNRNIFNIDNINYVNMLNGLISTIHHEITIPNIINDNSSNEYTININGLLICDTFPLTIHHIPNKMNGYSYECIYSLFSAKINNCDDNVQLNYNNESHTALAKNLFDELNKITIINFNHLLFLGTNISRRQGNANDINIMHKDIDKLIIIVKLDPSNYIYICELFKRIFLYSSIYNTHLKEIVFNIIDNINNKQQLIEIFGMFTFMLYLEETSGAFNIKNCIKNNHYDTLNELDSPYAVVLAMHFKHQITIDDINRFRNHVQFIGDIHVDAICLELEMYYAKQLNLQELTNFVNNVAKSKNNSSLQKMLSNAQNEHDYKEFQNIETLAEQLPPEYKEILEDLTCPITHALMYDPVIASDGFTYERSHIEEYMKTNKISPMTRELITHELVPNIMAKKLIKSLIAASTATRPA